MRRVGFIIIIVLLGIGGWLFWEQHGDLNSFVLGKLEKGDFQTLEAKYTPEQIMESNRKDLLKGEGYSFLAPSLKFYPYALLNVKYSKDAMTTSEGVLLWGLEDGEAVIDTSTWEKTHGFEDCLNAKASQNDFKIVNALAQNSGIMDREKLLQTLSLGNEALDSLLESVKKKMLVIQKGNYYRLHLQRPKLLVKPETRLASPLVTKSSHEATKASEKYSLSQIETTAKNAFGEDFTLRAISEVYLPVYSIVIQNPDGSQLTTHWNALTGKRITNSSGY